MSPWTLLRPPFISARKGSVMNLVKVGWAKLSLSQVARQRPNVSVRRVVDKRELRGVFDYPMKSLRVPSLRLVKFS